MSLAVDRYDYEVFFVCGALRSGTTLTRLILDAHSRIACPLEFDFIVDFEEDPARVSTKSYGDWLRSQRIFRDSGLEIVSDLKQRDLVCAFLDQIYQKTEKSIVGGVVHRKFERLLSFWPRARFVHLTRDPRDVAMSTVSVGWAGNYWFAADHWIESETSWNNLKVAIGSEQILEIRYEDVVRNPSDVFELVCGFLGVNYEPHMLLVDQRSTYSPPDPSLACKWIKTMSPRQVRLVEAKTGDLMVSRKYSRHQHSPENPGVFFQALLKLHNGLYRLVFNFRCVGPVLFTGEYVSRILRMRDWNRRINDTIDENLKARLK